MNGRNLTYEERQRVREDRQKKLKEELEKMEKEQEERKKQRQQRQTQSSSREAPVAKDRDREREREKERELREREREKEREKEREREREREHERDQQRLREKEKEKEKERERERREKEERERKEREKERQRWQAEQEEKLLAIKKEEDKRKKIVENRVTRTERHLSREIETRKKEIQDKELQALSEGDARAEERKKRREQLQKQREEEERRFIEEREQLRLEREKKRQEGENAQKQRATRLTQRHHDEKERSKGKEDPSVTVTRTAVRHKSDRIEPARPVVRNAVSSRTLTTDRAPVRRTSLNKLPDENSISIHSSRERSSSGTFDDKQQPIKSSDSLSTIEHIVPTTRPRRSSMNADAAREAVALLQTRTETKKGRAPLIRDDPTRKITEAEQPTHIILTYPELELSENRLDYETLKEHFLRQGRLSRDCVVKILNRAIPILKEEPNVVKLSAPITVVGDIHGQFYDLCNLFKLAGDPDMHRYLFLGDYVDRGFFSFECMMYLITLKVTTPNRIYLIRGNHETRAMTAMHSFKDEILHKFDQDIYTQFMELFDCLPLGAIVTNVQGDWFCCHGGLSPNLSSVDDVQNINRFVEPEEETLMMDLLWADPLEESCPNQRFKENFKRDCSYCFGYDSLSEFLEKNKFLSLIRAHEVKQDGFEQHWYKKFNPDVKVPPCITVFSAPNYCDTYANSGAYLKVDLDIYTLHQIAWVDHPYVLPKFQNSFAFSLPFVLENAMQVLVKAIQVLSAVELEEEKEDEEQHKTKENKGRHVPIHTRLRVATENMLNLKNWRENNAQAIQKLTPNSSIATYGRSITVGAVMTKKKSWFEAVKEIDEENEKLVFENPAAMANQRRLRRTQTFKY